MLGLILATDLKQGMSRGGRIPWNISEDLGWFKHVTMDSVLIMGTNTRKTLPRRGLPGRTIRLLSRREGDGIKTPHEMADLIKQERPVWIAGGPECIRVIVGWNFIPDVILWTHIMTEYDCDNAYPEVAELAMMDMTPHRAVITEHAVQKTFIHDGPLASVHREYVTDLLNGYFPNHIRDYQHILHMR